MRTRSLWVLGQIAAGALIVLGAFGTALAQDEAQGDDSQVIEQLGEDGGQPAGAPGRVAQLSDAEGSVSLEPAGTSSWTAADLNRPLTLGDKIWSDQDSRAELNIGDAVIRLGSTTGISFLNLDDQTAQMQVTAGTVIVHVDSLASGEVDEIDTPNLALTLQQPGVYRIEVSDTGDSTIVKVEEGEALASGGGQSYPVAAQQSVTFTGTNTLAADYATLGSPDSLDEWSDQRDRQAQEQAAEQQQYVPPDTVGSDDLSSYGTWQYTPDWGYAWFPVVAAGWAPFSVGYWAWISPWGWTWIDQEPWGFAPFHYGRWGYTGRGWCWVPGPRRARPVYSSAPVAWVGGSGDRVGWFPLGPRDAYGPGARGTNITYMNQPVAGAITVVSRTAFTSAEPVPRRRVSLSQGELANLRASAAAPAITPMRQSVVGANSGRAARVPPRALIDRPVVARLAPPRAPVPFASEQAAIRANGGRPLPMATLSRMRPNTPAAQVRFAAPAAPGNRSSSAAPGLSSREHALQQPALSEGPRNEPRNEPRSEPRNDRPSWAQTPPTENRETPPFERAVPPQRAAPQRPFTPPPSYNTPSEREPVFRDQEAPPQAPVPREPLPAPREREPMPRMEAPAPRSAPPSRPAPSESHSQGQRPYHPPSGRRADAGALPRAFSVGYAEQAEAPPPMYRPQENTIRYATPSQQAEPAGAPYHPPVSPPPMYRPIPVGAAAAPPALRGGARFAADPRVPRLR